jgi:hypothetical protein
MASSINGIGTTWYGKADPEDDGSYIVTEWIIFVYVPLIPLGSKRVRQIESGQFEVSKVPLHMPHLLKGYAVTLGLFVLFKYFLK